MADSIAVNDGSNRINYVDTQSARSNSKTLSVGTDTFLKLLVAQLQYQNPLDPQTDTEFVAQLAQMTSLEQMQNMNSTLINSQASSMIGKIVYAEVLDSNSGITYSYEGYVDSIIFKNGSAYVVIGNTAIPVSNVLRIYSDDAIENIVAPEAPENPENTDDNQTPPPSEIVDETVTNDVIR
ncbi:MAG TPA: flagellar hook capping FlgD N-terminal domain-containing protein [Bacillota bacterium]|nr:flagellar hook capping FlgD N-terminal domain-containing protein [Bacillota bacterium]